MDEAECQSRRGEIALYELTFREDDYDGVIIHAAIFSHKKVVCTNVNIHS